MAPGRRGLAKIQWAKETTNGTAVATATALFRGDGGFLDDQRVIEEVSEMVGIFDGADRTHEVKRTAALAINSTPATFEQLPYFFAAMFGGPVTGSADGTGSTGFTYTTNIPTTTAPTNTSYTIQTGDDVEVEQMTYGKVVKVELAFDQGKAVTMTASWIGQQVTRLGSAFTPSNLTLVSVEDVITGTGKFYLDAISGTAGTTQISNQVLAGKLTFEAMWVPKWTVSGNLYWDFAIFTGKKITGEVTYEHDATSIVGASGELANWRAQTPRLLQLKFTGSAYATPGTGGNGARTLKITLPTKYLKFTPVDSISGNDIRKAQFSSRYNATAGNAGSIVVSNEVSALP